MEAIYWQQRSGCEWILKGDNNTKYFQLIANGRRRKNFIKTLDTDMGVMSEQEKLIEHIVTFYKQLFGQTKEKYIKLGRKFSNKEDKVNNKVGNVLFSPFSEK